MKLHHIIVVVLIFFIISCGNDDSPSPPVTPPTTPPTEEPEEAILQILSDTQLDFGEVTIGCNESSIIQIKNNGDLTLEIAEVITPPNFSTNINSITISSGETITMEVMFSPDEVKEYRGKISFISNSSNQTGNVNVIGIGLTNRHYGDMILSTQEEVDNFDSCIKQISGTLIIGVNNGVSNINNINPLLNLELVEKDLKIRNCNSLTNLIGLEALTKVGEDVVINNNYTLSDLNGLQNLTSIGKNLLIYNNNSLKNLNGLQSLETIEENFYLYNNNSLTDVQGLGSINTIGKKLYIRHNPILASLIGLSSITSIGSIDLSGNDILENVNGFEHIKDLSGDLIISFGALSDLSGLRNLTVIGGSFSISNNYTLQTLNDLNQLTEISNALDILNSYALLSLNGLNNLSVLGSLNIETTENLSDIDLPKLLTTNEISISRCKGLTELSGFNNLTSSESNIYIIFQEDLKTISGFNSLESVGRRVQIYDNDGLLSIDGFTSLQSVGERFVIVFNDYLESLTGFSNLTNLGTRLEIKNSQVTNFCRFQEAVKNGSISEYEYEISSNLYNPTYQQIQVSGSGGCEQ